MLQTVILVPKVDMYLPTSFSAYTSVRFARDLSGQRDVTTQLHPPHPFGIYISVTASSLSFRNMEMMENMGGSTIYCSADLVYLVGRVAELREG